MRLDVVVVLMTHTAKMVAQSANMAEAGPLFPRAASKKS